MIETKCGNVVFFELIEEIEKQFDFDKDYFLDDAKTGETCNDIKNNICGFFISVCKFTDDEIVDYRSWRPETIRTNGFLFGHKEKVIKTQVTPAIVPVIVIADNFATIYDKSLYKWVIRLIKNYDLDYDGKFKIYKCW